MNNQDQTIIVPLGHALQDARLAASLTAKEVAEKLHLSLYTIRDVEDDLDNVIKSGKYPIIYLRGYILNYAKLVSLTNLELFTEYHELSGRQKHLSNLHSAVSIYPEKKRLKKFLLWFFLIVILGFCFFVVKQYFFSDKPALSDTQVIKNSVQKNASFSDDIKYAHRKVVTLKKGAGSNKIESPDSKLQTKRRIVAHRVAVKKKVE